MSKGLLAGTLFTRAIEFGQTARPIMYNASTTWNSRLQTRKTRGLTLEDIISTRGL